jgi:DNA-directed RNA polymerase beta subunit
VFCQLPQEESNEFGGTFICNGIERIIRMLVQVRHPAGASSLQLRKPGCGSGALLLQLD